MQELLDFDRTHLWHPYTSMVDPPPTVFIERADGTTLFTKDGRKLTDGMASWWCAIHGYNHPALNDAAIKQLRKMPHVMFGGITHEPAITLGKKLLEIVPKGLEKIFFSDSGSVSVEVALKMALQFQHAKGKNRKRKIMTFRGGYHGDTFGAMSVCDPVTGMHTLFHGMLPEQFFLLKPAVPFSAASFPENEITQLERFFNDHAEESAAFILEPVVQGAGGMYFYHPDYLRHISRLCKEHEMLLIADEIATGFGRTGKMFAVQWAEIVPDIMCVGKALTNGMMTLAATLTTRHVAETISSNGNVFMHGPTFMGNPLACAVAAANLDLLAEGIWKSDIPRLEKQLRNGLTHCSNHSDVVEVRVLGGIGVVEMKQPVDTRKLQSFFIERSVWIRPFGKLIYLMPPYTTTDSELERLTSAIVDAVNL